MKGTMTMATSLSSLAIMLNHFVSARYRWHSLRGSALVHYQDRRARALVDYTRQHSPFYRDYWSGHDLHDWRSLPTINKQMMMEHFDHFNTRAISRSDAMQVALKAEHDRDFRPQIHDITVGLSSGTSGHRGLFLASPWEQAAWAGTMLARMLHTIPRSQLRVAFFLRSNSNLYEQVGKGPIQFRYFDLMSPLPIAINELNAFQPHILVGPPSLLMLLAQAEQDDRLTILPDRLISVAEVLEKQDQHALEEVFSAPVQQVYQCTEGWIAASCAHGSLHVQEDIVALQFEPISDTDPTRVTPIVTDLWRKTQPIIRYRLNDVLQLDEKPCPCGSSFRVIHAIEGRCDDLCSFKTISGELRPFFPDTIRRMILLADPAILDYRVVQDASDHLSIYITHSPHSPFDDVAQSIRTNVSTILTDYDCRPIDLTIESHLPAQMAGTKLRRIIHT
jgi:putative adenylate-forming enzyme